MSTYLIVETRQVEVSASSAAEALALLADKRADVVECENEITATVVEVLR